MQHEKILRVKNQTLWIMNPLGSNSGFELKWGKTYQLKEIKK